MLFPRILNQYRQMAMVLVGVLDEWHQAVLPGRQAGWDDLAADAVGGIAGALLLAVRFAAAPGHGGRSETGRCRC